MPPSSGGFLCARVAMLTGAVLVAAWALAACHEDRRGRATAARAAPLASPVETHRRCGWIAAHDEEGVRTFLAQAAFFDAIHPKWFELGPDGALRQLPGADDERLVASARAHRVALMPMVAAVRDPAPLQAILADPRRRSAHVHRLVELAVTRGYAGLDIDYEKLWGATDRAGYEAFIDELASAMHAAGKQLSAAVPGQTQVKRGSPWDYAFLAARLDRVHIMAFDLHTVGTHAGPVAPQGWVEAVIAHARATGMPGKFLLGLPNYGVTPTWSGGSRRSAALCGGVYEVTDAHMAECPRGSWAAGRAPHCDTARGLLHFDDLASLEDKVAAARRAELGGITYWHLGDEPEGFFEMIERHYP